VRYLLFTLPAWALLAAVALGRGRVVWTVLALIAVAGLAVPDQLAIRASNGHGEDTRQLADIITAQAQPSDGVVYGMTDAGGNWVGRDTVAHYVPADRRPKDVLLTQPERTGGQLAAVECADVVKCLGNTPRLWVVRLGNLQDPLSGLDGQKEPVLRARYQVIQAWHPEGLTLALVVLKPKHA
jgi:mannosyltransferase